MGRDMYRGHVVSAGLSLPVFVSRGGGVADVLSVPLNLAEQQALKASADILKLSAIMARWSFGNRAPCLLDLLARKRRTRGCWFLLSSFKSRNEAQRRRVR
jgi:hypothetical protein